MILNVEFHIMLSDGIKILAMNFADAVFLRITFTYKPTSAMNADVQVPVQIVGSLSFGEAWKLEC